ncbi:hypothetical protein CONLIGDRAFT_638504 [Coniochaeta ligniaria NRRL 30616]|uniref:Uncharacterized protein n=1 Tax=Coniochaeta ligniaria NRRL 30616 TaxID=1408157 RepID=A0A1J7I3K9_9PEZI|nr:hypothetical protein CONLIGDRAFT_638504 [Coniochaeta ligniaria NRRL 30616]
MTQLFGIVSIIACSGIPPTTASYLVVLNPSVSIPLIDFFSRSLSRVFSSRRVLADVQSHRTA